MEKIACVTTECPLQCLRCALWKEDQSDIDLTTIKILPSKYQKPILDIMGGDPLLHPDLAFFLNNHQNFKIRLWTTGTLPVEQLQKIQNLISEIYVYLPTIFSDKYIEITGADYLDTVLDFITYIKEIKKSVTINCPVYPDTIQDMPFIHEYAKSQNIPICFHFSQDFSKESYHYLYRYHRIKGTYIIKIDHYSNCIAYPDISQNSWKTQALNIARHILQL